LKYFKIGVSGASETGHCGAEALEKAEELGREIVRHNGVVMAGAASGAAFWAAKGAEQEKGFTVAFSPALNEREHVGDLNLPTDYFDIIIYTGFGYSGRNLLLSRSSDAIIIVCGRSGTLHEFLTAFEDRKPIGVLESTGGVADLVRDLVPKFHEEYDNIAYDTDPKRLLEKVIAMVKQEKVVELSDKQTL